MHVAGTHSQFGAALTWTPPGRRECRPELWVRSPRRVAHRVVRRPTTADRWPESYPATHDRRHRCLRRRSDVQPGALVAYSGYPSWEAQLRAYEYAKRGGTATSRPGRADDSGWRAPHAAHASLGERRGRLSAIAGWRSKRDITVRTSPVSVSGAAGRLTEWIVPRACTRARGRSRVRSVGECGRRIGANSGITHAVIRPNQNNPPDPN